MPNHVIVSFDKNGDCLTNPLPALPSGVTDLFILSHGWNNDVVDADGLYTKWADGIGKRFATDAALTDRVPYFLGVIWPAKALDKRILNEPEEDHGGAVSLAVDPAKIKPEEIFEDLKTLLGEDEEIKLLDEAKALSSQPGKKNKFVSTVRDLFRKAARGKENEDAQEDALGALFDDSASDILSRLSVPLFQHGRPAGNEAANTAFTPPAPSGGDAGTADVGGALVGFQRSAAHLANYLTYYTMKKRAGAVGINGVAKLIDHYASKVERIHLVGHSFGGRVVAAAALGCAKTDRLRSMSLCQTAFSHHGFSASEKGFFRKVIDEQKVNGPILATHSWRDRAVGVAYPLASRISRDMRNTLGDANDPFGGLGRNGAQKTKEVENLQLLAATGSYLPFGKNIISNLNGDEIIQHHGDVTREEVIHAIAVAVR